MHFLEEHPISARQLPEPAEQDFYRRFTQIFQLTERVPAGLTRLTWPSESQANHRVLQSPIIEHARPLYVILEVVPKPIVYSTDWATAKSFFLEEHVQADYYLVDSSLRWCLAISHDDFLYLNDPDGLFRRRKRRVRDET